MALLNILKYPDSRLHKVATSIIAVDEEIRSFVEDMKETMYASKGIGLAATQVNYHKKIIIIDISENKDDLLILINPELIEASGEQVSEEGCLSVPEIFEKVQRFKDIKIRAIDQHGISFDLETGGLLSVCIQHELDHLMGKVFVEYLSQLKKDRIRKKMIKTNKKVLP